MKRYDVFLQFAVCLALGGAVTALWICAVIGFGLHTTVGKEALYLWLLLQLPELAVTALQRRKMPSQGALLPVRRALFCLWCGGAALLLFSLGAALAGLSCGSMWVSLPCTLGTVGAALGWAGRLVCLRLEKKKQKELNR